MLKMINNEMNVGFDELVNVFVSKFEEKLYVKKESLSKSIKEVKSNVEKLKKEVLGKVNLSKYEIVIDVLGLKCKVNKDSISVYFSEDRKKSSYIDFVVYMYDVNDKSLGYCVNSKRINVDIDVDDVVEYESYISELNKLNEELIEVVNEIKSISRKERSIRSKISEMKLKECGLEELLGNDEIMKLIELK
jgi:hypothetical protein